MDVEGMSEAVEVIQVSLVVEGPIISDFKGFEQGAKFEFSNGQVWEQNENKYSHHYANRPHAIIVNGIEGFQLKVDGIAEPIRVRKI